MPKHVETSGILGQERRPEKIWAEVGSSFDFFAYALAFGSHDVCGGCHVGGVEEFSLDAT